MICSLKCNWNKPSSGLNMWKTYSTTNFKWLVACWRNCSRNTLGERPLIIEFQSLTFWPYLGTIQLNIFKFTIFIPKVNWSFFIACHRTVFRPPPISTGVFYWSKVFCLCLSLNPYIFLHMFHAAPDLRSISPASPVFYMVEAVRLCFICE